jgi:hypothetical protein
MAMKALTVAALAVAISATSANAQATMTTSFGAGQQSTAFGVDPVTRVTSSFRTAVAVSEPQAIPDAKTQETARRTLYGMAEAECAVLSEIFKAECRLNNVSMILLVPTTAVPPNTLGATATYDLRPKAK